MFPQILLKSTVFEFMKGILFVLIAVSGISISKAQQKPLVSNQSNQKISSVTISCFFAYHYPGFAVGYEKSKPLKQKNSNKHHYTFSRILGGQVAGFSKQDFNMNINWQILAAFRSSSKRGFFSDLGLMQGMAHTFLNAPAYKVNPNSSVTAIKVPLNNYGYTTGYLKAGVDLSKTKSPKNLMVYFKPAISFMWPYNQFLFPYVINEVGINFKLK